MTSLPLRCGPLLADDFAIQRSGIAWLCEDGHLCRPNEVIAYCNIGLERTAAQRTAPNPFAEERELQVAFAPRVGGRVRWAPGTSPGGHLNVHRVQPWDADAVLGFLEVPDGAAPADAGTARLLMLAGRRISALADGYTGLLPGWHNRSRGWWSEPASVPGPTLLSLGVCDAEAALRGDRLAFTEMFEIAPHPAQIVFTNAHPLTPCAPVLAEQFLRQPAAYEAIAADLRRGLTEGRVRPSADDWLFAGMLLAALARSPMRDGYAILTPSGLRRSGPAEAILLSLNAEFPTILRHRKLGYALHVMRHYQQAAGPGMRAWLDLAFEPVRRTVADIRLDYARLFEMVARETAGRFLVVNRMSTAGQEDVASYAAFDAPMAATLESIASKELNLMLHDLAEEHDIAIIDVDAIAAEFGGAAHLPDGIHQSGPMQAAVRAEILHCLMDDRPLESRAGGGATATAAVR